MAWIVKITCDAGSDILTQQVLDPSATCPSFPGSPQTGFEILYQEDGTGGVGPGSTNTSEVKDDFWGGSLVSPSIGELGWISDSMTLFPAASHPDHPGIVGAYSLSQFGSMFLSPQNSYPLHGSWLFDCTFVVFPLINNATTGIRIGLTSDPTQNSTRGIFFEKNLLDTNYFATTRESASLVTRVSSGIGTFPAWRTFRIRRINLTDIAFSIDHGDEITIATTIPLINLKPTIQMNGLVGVQAYFVDYFACKVFNINR